MLSQIIPSKPAGNPRVRLRVPRGFWLAGVLCPLRRRDFSPPASVRRGVVKSRPGGGVQDAIGKALGGTAQDAARLRDQLDLVRDALLTASKDG